MKVEIIKGTVNNGVKTFAAGETLDLDDKEAENLIALGIVKKSGTETPATPQPNPNAKAAEKRKALEEKALELKIGTAEEIKAMSDADLGKNIGKVNRQNLIEKAVAANLGNQEELSKVSNDELVKKLEGAGIK